MTNKQGIHENNVKKRYDKPEISSHDLPPELSIGECGLDPTIFRCATTTLYEQNPQWFPGVYC